MALANSLPLFVAGDGAIWIDQFCDCAAELLHDQRPGQWSIGRTITLISASFSFGFILGPLIGGWIGEHRGLHANFSIAAAIFVVSTAIILFIRPQPVEKDLPEDQICAFQALLNERYIRYLLLAFLHHVWSVSAAAAHTEFSAERAWDQPDGYGRADLDAQRGDRDFKPALGSPERPAGIPVGPGLHGAIYRADLAGSTDCLPICSVICSWAAMSPPAAW